MSISSNVNINDALINIIKIIKYVKNKFNYTNKKTAKLLGLISSKNENDHIISYSLKNNIDDNIDNNITIDYAKNIISENLLIIFEEIIKILKITNNITQAELSRQLDINKDYDVNNWITYLLVELLNDSTTVINIIIIKNNNDKVIKKIIQLLDNSFSFYNISSNVNDALINIIKIIKYVKNKFNYTNKKTAKLLGLISSKNENDHIISYSLKNNIDDNIDNNITIDYAKNIISENLLIIFEEIIKILKITNNITQAELSRQLDINKDYDVNNWITYLLVELLNDSTTVINIIIIKNNNDKVIKKIIQLLDNSFSFYNI